MLKSTSWKTLLLEKALLPVADLVTKQQVMRSYRFFQESQWWPLERLQEFQNVRLRNTIQTAYSEVPFYREVFDRHGIRVEDISTRNDLVRIPPASKEDLRKAYPDRCVRKVPYPIQEFFTSGSSGKPFAVKVDSLTLSEARALMFIRANFSGWEIGDPFLQTGMTLERGVIKRAKDFLLGVQYVSAFDLSDAVLDRYLSAIENRRLRFVMGYPGSIFFLAKRARQVGFNHHLSGIVCWGDNLYQHYRQEMEKAFGCRVTDTYGCGEGIQVAAQCGESNDAYHIFMPHVIVEVVDENGAPVPTGTQGTILLTRLNAGAMPLVRYQVGDMGRMGQAIACSCGRGLETMAAIDGRDTDVVITPRGNRLIVHFFTGIFEYFPSIDTFRITQERQEAILVEIVPRPDFRPEHWAQIKKEILEKGDPDLVVEMVLVNEIAPGASNKRRFVVSKLPEKKGEWAVGE
jgi:phenylacetate-CoA ligase